MSQDARSTAPVLFFSHSSKDVKLLHWFVIAARIGLHLNAKSIRFSSDAAYGFEPGQNIADLARDEVTKATVFIAVVTPNSVDSQWFLAELALRFGSKKTLYLVMANGAEVKDIPDPYKGIAAVKCTTEELQSLFDRMADQLDPEKPYDYKTANEFLDKSEAHSNAEADGGTDEPTAFISGLETTAKATFIPQASADSDKKSIKYKVKCDALPAEGNSLWICVEIEGKIWPKEPGPISFSQAGDSLESSIKENSDSRRFFLELIEVNPEGNEQITKWFADGQANNNYPGIDKLTGGRVAYERVSRDQ